MSLLKEIKADLEINKCAWDIAATAFEGCCVLPDWGPFGEARHLDLLGQLAGQTVMEIGCGSGHSIARAVERGAARVIGIDLSTKQIELASILNQAEIECGRVHLIEAPMEQPLALRDIDVVFSIQALGWTFDPRATFRNIASYLKPGGRLVWSGGHPLFGKILYQEGNLALTNSYFNEQPQFMPGWCGSEGAIFHPRTISTWFRHQIDAGFAIRSYLEPAAEVFPETASDPSRYYSRVKAEAVPCTIIFVCERS